MILFTPSYSIHINFQNIRKFMGSYVLSCKNGNDPTRVDELKSLIPDQYFSFKFRVNSMLLAFVAQEINGTLFADNPYMHIELKSDGLSDSE